MYDVAHFLNKTAKKNYYYKYFFWTSRTHVVHQAHFYTEFVKTADSGY